MDQKFDFGLRVMEHLMKESLGIKLVAAISD